MIKELLFTIALVLIIVVSWRFVKELPLVAIDTDGNCKWVELAPDFERRDCPTVLPSKYERVFVK